MNAELKHREDGTEADGFYCWCLPKVEWVQSKADPDVGGWVVVHNDPKTKGGES